MSWKYRGQVLLHNACIESTIEIIASGRDERGAYAIADASLWVDGKRIYEASNVGMRIVPASDEFTRLAARGGEVVVDPAVEPWLADHCPTYTRPALPFMSVVDLLADSAGDEGLVGLNDVRVFEWLVMDEPLRMTREREGDQVRLLSVDDGRVLASARLRVGEFSKAPDALEPIQAGEAVDPYHSGDLFHGPRFQLASGIRRSELGATSTVAAVNEIRGLRINPGLLDAATHGIPHDRLEQWFSEVDEGVVAYPALIKRIDFFGPTPTTGALRCEVRPAGIFGTADFPVFDIQLIGDDGVWATIRLVERCFPKGPIGSVGGASRRAFLQAKEYVPGVRLSADDLEATSLVIDDLTGSDWFPGTIEAVYGTVCPSEICRRERVAASHGLHPGLCLEQLPITRFDLEVEQTDGLVLATGSASGELDITPVTQFWSSWFDVGRWPVEDLYYGLIEQFTDRVVLEDPSDFESLSGQSVLYLANHETAVESLIFSIVVSGLTGVPTVTLAKAEHRETWLGKLIQHCVTYPDVEDPRVMTFFDRDDRESLRSIIGELAMEMAEGGRSVMVHIEGTRALHAGHRVEKMTGAFIDMALKIGVPIVPVRFTGGLPVDPLDTRLEFPVEMGRQSIWLGKSLRPEALAGMHYGARKEAVIGAINALAHGEVVEPSHADAAFAARVDAWKTTTSVSEEHAVLREVLFDVDQPCEEVAQLLAASGASELGETDAEGWLVELTRRLIGG
jgi:1-acyl-sn-glycerol-3-phosphate acyltransferase